MSSFNRSITTAAKVTLPIKVEEKGGGGQNQTKQDEETQITSVSVLDLPSIAIDIVSRLPIRTIFQCRCVCKSWRNLVLDPYFSVRYLMRPSATSLVLSLKSCFYLLELGEDYNYTYSGAKNPLCITNPILGEYAFLPVPKRKKKVLKVASGFGFIPTSGKYKLLRAVLRRDHGYHPKSEGAVCTLGTNIWRKLGEMPFPLHGKFCSANLHGALYWIDDDFTKPGFIFSFELENEQVRPIPSPPVDAFGHKTIWVSLGVLGECLCIFDNLSYSHLVLWKMKYYGIAESWTRDIILKTSFPAMLPTRWLRSVTNWKDREILSKCGNGVLVSYNPNMHGFERLKVSGFEWVFASVVSVTPITFAPSFSPLKNAMTCDGMMRVKVQSI